MESGYNSNCSTLTGFIQGNILRAVYLLALLALWIAVASFVVWQVRYLRGTSADQSLVAATGMALLLAAIVISLPIEFAGPSLILPAVVVEETLKFAVLKASASRARGYGSVLWLAAWELPISKGLLVYGIADAEARAWMDANFPVMITGALSAFLMHVVTARLFYRVPNPAVFLLLAVALHYATNWTVRFEDPLAMLVIAGVKVIAFAFLILGLPLNRDETAAARA